jgi:hypothetical protein
MRSSKPKPKKKRLRRKGGGRKPIMERIRATWVNYGKCVRFDISEDIADQLQKAHHAMFGAFYMHTLMRAKFDPYKIIRIEFMRFEDTGIPGVFMRIEPPTFAPEGKKLWRSRPRRKILVQAQAKELGLKESQKPVNVEILFEPKMPGMLGGGMMMIFPDEYMNFSVPKVGRKKPSRDSRLVGLHDHEKFYAVEPP